MSWPGGGDARGAPVALNCCCDAENRPPSWCCRWPGTPAGGAAEARPPASSDARFCSLLWPPPPPPPPPTYAVARLPWLPCWCGRPRREPIGGWPLCRRLMCGEEADLWVSGGVQGLSDSSRR